MCSWKRRKTRELVLPTKSMRKYIENIIIGAGISGLTIARLLEGKKIPYLIFDSRSNIGGKLETIKHGEYDLDVGFQIIIEDYPAFKIFPEIKNIKIKRFESGFIINKNKNFYKILNPIKNPIGFLKNSSFPDFSIKDKLLLIVLFLKNEKSKNLNVIEYLTNLGFSKKFINDFFKSFFQGVFLDKNLQIPLEYFLFIYKLFAKSNVGIPIGGINSLATLLSNKLNKNKIELNNKIIKINENSIIDSKKNEISFRRLFCTDPSLESLIDDDINVQIFKDIQYKKTFNYYLVVNINNISENIIYLFPDSNIISSLYFSKKNGDNYLVSISSLNCDNYNDIKNEFISYFKNVNSLELIQSFNIKKALPYVDKFYKFKNKSYIKYTNKIYFSGDFLSTPSINGSIESADNLIEDLEL